MSLPGSPTRNQADTLLILKSTDFLNFYSSGL
jgi:hypothetical protein